MFSKQFAKQNNVCYTLIKADDKIFLLAFYFREVYVMLNVRLSLYPWRNSTMWSHRRLWKNKGEISLTLVFILCCPSFLFCCKIAFWDNATEKGNGYLTYISRSQSIIQGSQGRIWRQEWWRSCLLAHSFTCYCFLDPSYSLSIFIQFRISCQRLGALHSGLAPPTSK